MNLNPPQAVGHPARNHVYGLGQKLASAYQDLRNGWGGGMMMMMMGGDPGDTTGTDPGGEDPPDPPEEDSCYTQMTYYVNDQYGSIRVGMSETAVLARIEYYPYGEVYSMSGGGSVYTFLGKEDPGVGMLDFGPRFYNATMGRFLSPDPILAGPSAYSYAEGNPIMLYDPSGMRSQCYNPAMTREEYEEYWDAWRSGYSRAEALSEREQELAIWRHDGQSGFRSRSGIGNENLPGGVGGTTPDGIVADGGSGQSYTEYELIHFTSNAGQDYYYFRKTGRVFRGVDSDWLGRPKGSHGCYIERILAAVKGAGIGAERTGGRFSLRPAVKLYGNFYGNQYVSTTYSYARLGARVARGAAVLSAVLGVRDIWDTFKEEGEFGDETKLKTVENVSGFAGAWIGAETLAILGSPAGHWGIGIGGVVGGVLGYFCGSETAKGVYEWFLKD